MPERELRIRFEPDIFGKTGSGSICKLVFSEKPGQFLSGHYIKTERLESLGIFRKPDLGPFKLDYFRNSILSHL